MKRGWTLHEMIVSLAVTGIIVALAAGAGAGQLRMLRGIGEIAMVRTQVSQAALVTAGVLRDVATRHHILVALDSAIEVAVTTGSSVTCRADTGRILIARPSAAGNTIGAFAETPQPGDGVEILAVDSTVGRIAARVAAAPLAAACSRFPWAEGWEVALAEPFVVQAGMPVRFTRRLRLSAYLASDSRWYLGMREWNPAQGRFNTIQPVAGPLLPYGGPESGFRLEYRDQGGALLALPDPSRIALVTVIARGDSRRPVRVAGMRSANGLTHRDSALLSIPFR